MATGNFSRFRLAKIERDGTLDEAWNVPAEIAEACRLGAAHFERVGYKPPWVGYAAFDEVECVGACAFKSEPMDGTVEISYMTLKLHQGKGYATEMVRSLIQIARDMDRSLGIIAQTMPEKNASSRVLNKVGFIHTGDVVHPDDGLVAEWLFI